MSEQNMKNSIVAKTIREAMETLENAPCGGVGESGPTIEEMEAAWANGQAYADDSMLDTAQHAYRLLQRALEKLGEVGR